MPAPFINRGQILLLISAFMLCVNNHPAFAQIAISPLRTVMTPEHPETQFTISNPTQRLMEARVSLIDLSASTTGYKPASPTAKAKISAAPWLIVSPVSFTLEPGQRQQITVHMRSSLPPPKVEHRSHLYIETNPARKNIYPIKDGGLALDVSLGVSVPIILRPRQSVKATNQGRDLQVQFTDTKLLRTKENMIKINTNLRYGPLENSLFGKINIFHKSKRAPFVTKELVTIENIAAYTDNDHRSVSLPLGLQTLPPGELLISYEGVAEYEGTVFGKKHYSVGEE